MGAQKGPSTFISKNNEIMNDSRYMRTGRLAPIKPLSLVLQHYRQLWSSENPVIKTNLFLWLVLFVTNIIDLIATYYAFSLGAVEANPAMDAVIKNFGDIGLAFYKGLMLGGLFIFLPFINKRIQKFLVFTVFVYIVLTISHMIRF